MRFAQLGILTFLLANVAISDFASKYENWVLGNQDNPASQVQQRVRDAKRAAKRAKEKLSRLDLASSAGLYDSRESGADSEELHLLITDVLPALSLAYRLFDDADAKDLTLQVFDRLHLRGFRKGMRMPWKPKQAEGVHDVAVIVDFQLRVSGYALATFLMRDALRESGRLARTLATCEAVISEDDKMGDLKAPKLNADGLRIAVNFTLPYLLTRNDAERLRHFRQQIVVSMQVESDASDTIKPDGLGFHHRGVYLAGYAPYAISQAAFVAWLFDSSELALPAETIATLSKSMATLRLVAHRYDMHKALAGRLSNLRVIPDVLLGYAYLSAFDHPDRRATQGMLARLADSAILARSFRPHRNEVPPGPGAISAFFATLAKAQELGAEPEPQGHWAFNYGPMAVHRHGGWMASVKGHHRYFWAFERSLTDARKDPRLENVLGFHDAAFSLFIYHGDASAYFGEGWDHCRIPATTARYISESELLAMDDPNFNRPFGKSPFCGGVSLERRFGLFAMQGQEQTPDQREQPLSYQKSAFFVDDFIVMLTSGISNGDGIHPVRTTLYQSRGVTPDPLRDPVGNAYVLLGDHALGYSTGPMAAAWIDHGVSPSSAKASYAILPGASEGRVAAFSKAPEVTVLRQGRKAHILHHKATQTTAFVYFQAGTWDDGPIVAVDRPCLVLLRQHADHFRLSICNPDLGWTEGKQYGRRGEFAVRDASISRPPPTPVQLTLRDSWELEPHAKASLSGRQLTAHLSDAQGLELRLRTPQP